jgi:uncharacterized membrane protein
VGAWPHPARASIIGSMTDYEAALFVHLFGVALLAAGMGAAAVGLEWSRRRRRPAEVAAVLGVARVGVVLVGVGTLALLVGGFWLMQVGAYDLGDGWLSGSLGLFALAAFLGAIGGRRPKQARLYAERLARDGAPSDAQLRQLLDDRVALVLNYVSAVVMVVVLALMITKP